GVQTDEATEGRARDARRGPVGQGPESLVHEWLDRADQELEVAVAGATTCAGFDERAVLVEAGRPRVIHAYDDRLDPAAARPREGRGKPPIAREARARV